MKRASDWRTHLIAAGARFDDSGLVTDFGDPVAEACALGEHAIVAPLQALGLIKVSGEDASRFLNAQLTSDVAGVSSVRAQYSGYCTPKGRLLATMLIVADGDNHWLVLPGELAEPVVARLQKYILRAKARLTVASPDFEFFGIAGPHAPAVATNGLPVTKQQDFQVQHKDGGTAFIALPGNRTLAICKSEHALSTWQHLGEHARPAGSHLWALQTIRSGIATITSATQEMFTPQMIALDRHGGVSFGKGCYPGQEIVARTRYLGEVKRRLYHGRCASPVEPGSIIIGEGDRNVGTVTNAAVAGQGEWEFLAVVQREAVVSQIALRLGDGDAVAIDHAVD